MAGSLPEKVRQAVGAVGPGRVARLPTDPVVASHVPPAAAAMNVVEAAAPASCRRQVLRRRAAACWSSLSSTPASGVCNAGHGGPYWRGALSALGRPRHQPVGQVFVGHRRGPAAASAAVTVASSAGSPASWACSA